MIVNVGDFVLKLLLVKVWNSIIFDKTLLGPVPENICLIIF